MYILFETALSNVIVTAALVLVVFALTKFVRHPTFAFWLWLIVLLKLVTPPVVRIP